MVTLSSSDIMNIQFYNIDSKKETIGRYLSVNTLFLDVSQEYYLLTAKTPLSGAGGIASHGNFIASSDRRQGDHEVEERIIFIFGEDF